MAILFPGTSVFVRTGNVKYQNSLWDLDKMIVPYQGRLPLLDAYLASLPMGAGSSINGNMFLTDYSVDDNKQFPTVEHIFTGKRSGGVPPDRHLRGETEQQARYTSPSGNTTVDITFIAPSATTVTWSRSDIDLSSVGVVEPADATVVWFVARTSDGSEIPPQGNLQAALAWFVQKQVTTGESDEIIPNQYFRANRTKINQLFSRGT